LQGAGPVRDEQQAKRYYVKGSVQGVGFRYFAQRAAQRLGLTGYVKNLRDGRVEIYAIGSKRQQAALRSELERGPGASSVSGVTEEDAAFDATFGGEFSIERES